MRPNIEIVQETKNVEAKEVIQDIKIIYDYNTLGEAPPERISFRGTPNPEPTNYYQGNTLFSGSYDSVSGALNFNNNLFDIEILPVYAEVFKSCRHLCRLNDLPETPETV